MKFWLEVNSNLPALLSAEVCGCEGSKTWLSQNNGVCVQNAGADNVYLLFISSQLCTTALSWEECRPRDRLRVRGCRGGLLLAVGAALGSVWVLFLRN